MEEKIIDELVVYKNEITNENYGVLGFEKILGKIQAKNENGDLESKGYTDLQTLANTLYAMANQIKCPVFYGNEKPQYNGKDITNGFWLDTSEIK